MDGPLRRPGGPLGVLGGLGGGGGDGGHAVGPAHSHVCAKGEENGIELRTVKQLFVDAQR